MSSSQNPSNNNHLRYQQQLADYETDDSAHLEQSSHRQTDHVNDDTQQQEPTFEENYPDVDDNDEDLPTEIVAELEARELNPTDDDDSIYSDAVQDAFQKYQREQEELYAEMEECWNYMMQETNLVDMPVNLVEQSQQSQLNPDAVEFKPTWSNAAASNIQSGLNRSNNQAARR